MIVDPDLRHVLRIVRDGVAVPTIVETVDASGPTRVREIESLGGFATYEGRTVPQVHADFTPDLAGGVEKSGVAKAWWYDAPQYALEAPQAQARVRRAASPFRSSAAEIEARIAERVDGTGPAPPATAHSHLRAYVSAAGPESYPHGAPALGLDDVRVFTRSKEVFDAGATGKGVLVAVLDTGVNGTHPMMDGAVKEHVSLVPEPPGTDLNGHGTWCASCIAGRPVEYAGRVAEKKGTVLRGMSEADILAVKVLTGEGSGSLSTVIQGVEAAVDRGARVLSMSLGGLFGGGGLGPDAQAVNEAAKRGINVVVASGNSGGFVTVGSPASAAGAIAVGSVAMHVPAPESVSSFSSRGPTSTGRIKPDIAAPGGNSGGKALDEAILAATSGVIEAEAGEPYAMLRGTSMATPAVAGIIAQTVPLGFPRERDAVEGVLAMSVRNRKPVPVKNNRHGWGVLDAVSLVRAVADKPRALPIRGLVAAQGRSRPVLGPLAASLAMMQRATGPQAHTFRLSLL